MKYNVLFVTFCFLSSCCQNALGQPMQFTDMSNRQIKLNHEPQRVVVIPIPAASMLVGIDENTQRLVGMHPFAKVAAKEGMLSKMFPDIVNIRSDTVGNNFMPNIETLLSVKPDLVWQWGHLGNDIITPMENVGLTVATLNYGKEAYTQKWIELMGLTLDQRVKAQAMIDWRNQVINDLQQATQNISETQKPKVLFLLYFNSHIQTFGATSHNNYDFELAGGISLNKDLTGTRTLNIEQILVWDPDIILLGNFEQGLKPQDVYDNPLLADVTAVKNHRVFKVPIGGFVWDAPNQETPLYWLWLSMIFHPDTMHWPLRELIAQHYQQLYNYQVSDEQIDQILQIQLNQVSNYPSFSLATHKGNNE
ncbi:ABC transporter substrate-binding protein [Gilliamella sp. wkB112]|uniref:ABC transporter substrate-binding protein n=1 Tax=Gilliamella sp. wkB112 TaxID=3120257 RepID=UPI00080EC2EF|nr:ABC transporter substrate-binding protein [Gilliamella apicola]OCG05339.1 ABC transporter substrate-binding protein [Gilliamella apicola]